MNLLISGLAQSQFDWAWWKYVAVTKKLFDTAAHAQILNPYAQYPILTIQTSIWF